MKEDGQPAIAVLAVFFFREYHPGYYYVALLQQEMR